MHSQEHDKLRADETAMRYKGMIEPPFAHRYTFAVSLPETDDRVRLWVDNYLVVDQWASLSGRHLTGTLAVDAIPALYALQLEYKDGNMTSAKPTSYAGPSLSWTYTDQTFPVASMRLYHAHQLPIKTSSGAGLSATYYSFTSGKSPDAATPILTTDTAPAYAQQTQLDWSGLAESDRPFPASVPDAGWKVRWSGFIIPSRSDMYTFYTPVAASYHTKGGANRIPPAVDVSERVRLWVDDVLMVDQWTSLSAIEPSATYAFKTAEQWYNLKLEYALTNRSQSSVPRGVTLLWANQAGRDPLLGLPKVPENLKVSKGRVPADRLLKPIISNKVIRNDYETWDKDWYSPSSEHLDLRLEQPSALPSSTALWDKVAGCPAPEPFSWRHELCRGNGVSDNNPARVRVRAAGLCADTSTVQGVAMSVSTAGVTRTFTLTARDAYDNQRDAVDDFFIARASLNSDNSDVVHGQISPQPWEYLSMQPAGLEPQNPVWDVGGKYEITYMITLSARYTTTVHASPRLPDGHGLVAAFFPPSSSAVLDQLVTRVDPSLTITWGTEGLPTHSDLIPAHGFRARWTGLIAAPGLHDARGQEKHVIFEAHADGPVAVFVNGKLVASTDSDPIFAPALETFSLHDNRGARSNGNEQLSEDDQGYSARGTIDLVPGVLYDIRVEYQRSATPHSYGYLNVTWGWGSVEQHPIPSSMLLPNRRPVDGGRLGLTVHPNVACASTSQVYGKGLTIATAGIPASFTIIVRDECECLSTRCCNARMHCSITAPIHAYLKARIFGMFLIGLLEQMPTCGRIQPTSSPRKFCPDNRCIRCRWTPLICRSLHTPSICPRHLRQPRLWQRSHLVWWIARSHRILRL